MNITISIIVPTHDRCFSLMRLLDILSRQTYPAHLFDVVIVADGCSDGTIKMLQQYEAPFTFRYIEQPGQGAATARNNGAVAATGEILLFLDDDIEPSLDLVMAHAGAHKNKNSVVVGYLPMSLPKKATIHQIGLITWWEQKYRNMSNPGYRYGYDDLLSGNFSISSIFFNKVNKFDCAFSCREDYELGARLIKSGAEIIFSGKAWGYHRDETTNVVRLHQRRRQEGKADLQFAKKHPELLANLPLAHYDTRHSIKKKAFLYFIFNSPFIINKAAFFLPRLLIMLESLKQRTYWHKLNGRLHQYWYLRGVADEAKTLKGLTAFFQTALPDKVKENNELKLNLDLKAGLLDAEKQIDQFRPDSVRINYGDHFIGEILPRPGLERLRGAHLRPLLATHFPESLMHALVMEQIADGTFKRKIQEV